MDLLSRYEVQLDFPKQIRQHWFLNRFSPPLVSRNPSQIFDWLVVSRYFSFGMMIPNYFFRVVEPIDSVEHVVWFVLKKQVLQKFRRFERSILHRQALQTITSCQSCQRRCSTRPLLSFRPSHRDQIEKKIHAMILQSVHSDVDKRVLTFDPYPL